MEKMQYLMWSLETFWTCNCGYGSKVVNSSKTHFLRVYIYSAGRTVNAYVQFFLLKSADN